MREDILREKESWMKEWFKGVRKERYEIIHLEELIKSAEMGLLPSGIRYDRDKVQTSPSDTMSAVLSKAADMQNELESSIAKLQDRRIEAEKLIRTLENSDEREVLRYYYLDTFNGRPLTWEQVSNRMNFNLRWVHRIHDRAITALVEKGGNKKCS